MTTAAIREKLQNYIRFADDKKVKAIYTILEDEISHEYEWCEDKEFVQELDRRVAAYESGKDKGYTLQEIKSSIDRLRKKRSLIK